MSGSSGNGLFDAFARRRAGLLLHPTSLPGPGPGGDLGPAAYHFVDFLAASGCSVWQMLPLGPTHADRSPYQCLSVHAGNNCLISLDWLVEQGWLEASEPPPGDGEAWRRERLASAHQGFRARASADWRGRYQGFVAQHQDWLEDYALYQALRQRHSGQPWSDWPAALRDRQADALSQARSELAPAADYYRFEQFVFFTQWHALRDYANRQGVLLFGDVPIFVAYDSAEVWAQREYFALDEEGRQQVVAGVPPDYFSATGQRWGNPHYRWERLQEDGFRWWVERLRTQLELFDLVRIDHFRGFEAYWEIPATAETAIDGHWVKAPGEALFARFREEFHALPLVAEDLGVITPEVDALRRRFSLPGMKILQFAFGGGPDNPYLPHNHEELSVVYTGTHDNDTTLGWYQALPDPDREHLESYLGHPGEAMPWPLIRTALASVARLAVVPLQDVLGLDGRHRMNTPGVKDGNWHWRFDWDMVPDDLAERLRHLITMYGREVL